MKKNDWISQTEAAALLKISTRTLYAWTKARKGPHREMIAGKPVYRRESVIAWAVEQEVALEKARRRGKKQDESSP